ncbi:hypothetical protein JRO89_XS13G0220200 [Xanthoceras sorbifolium]|uniref:Uncharacterized protein n=1 Tax=Xanthoceras sorbifolium TaxID=99658 RepID=A0ABQ8H9H5_9ROSI|nr:hypothetical protein JRO89_XS13G0220200 [Xanthoceras sorbifolium]
MTTTNTRPSSDEDDSAKVGVGQGELYSPPYAIQLIPTNKQQQLQQDTIAKMVIRLVTIKEKVLEKLASAPIPADALDTARHFLETVVRDFIVAAHGLTKDALLRINTHLVPLLPSLSPNITRKVSPSLSLSLSLSLSFLLQSVNPPKYLITILLSCADRELLRLEQ